MSDKIPETIQKYIDANIATFHNNRLRAIKDLDLMDLLKRKNPYLFKAKSISTSSEFVKSLLDAHLSSQEETMFGTFLSGLAKIVCSESFHGIQNPAKGVDIDFMRDNKRYFVSIKSGPNWGNSKAIQKMLDNFKNAKEMIGDQEVLFINGCCYGRDLKENKGRYIKKCGQSFWDFISGDTNFHKKMIKIIGTKAEEKNEEFSIEYEKAITKFDKIFVQEFCCKDGSIDWEWFVEYNSSLYPRGRLEKMLDDFLP